MCGKWIDPQTLSRDPDSRPPPTCSVLVPEKRRGRLVMLRRRYTARLDPRHLGIALDGPAGFRHAHSMACAHAQW